MFLNILIGLGFIGLVFYCVISAYKNDRTPKAISNNIFITLCLIVISFLLAERFNGLFLLVIVSVVVLLHNVTVLFGKRNK